MDNQLILSQLTTAELSDIIAEKVVRILKEQNSLPAEDPFLSTMEVCKLFEPQISVQTLHRWRKEGLLPEPRYVGSRTFWMKSEILAATKSLKRYQHYKKETRLDAQP